jgi:phosphopantetheine--protein transferase-like protein
MCCGCNLKDGVFGKLNVGVDIIEIKWFRNKPLNKDNASFYHSIFTESELMYCMKYSNPYPHIAGIFAAKESILKCLTIPLRMIDIEIKHNQDGKPSTIIRSKKTKAIQARVSISHTKSIAIAAAVTDS